MSVLYRLVLAVLLLTTVCAAQNSFDITIVDSGLGVGGYTDLALLSDGSAVIAYQDDYNNQLRLAIVDGENYTIETVLENAGQYASLAISSYDEIAILHQHNQRSLNVAVKSVWASWSTTVVDDDVFFHPQPGAVDFTFSPLDQPHAVYLDSYERLNYASYDQQQNTWINTIIFSGLATMPGIIVDNNNQPIVVSTVYENQQFCILVQKHTDVGWQSLPTIPGEAASVGIDAQGNVAVAYMYQGQLLYRTFLPALGWFNPAVIDDGTQGQIRGNIHAPVLKFDSAGHAHIVYCCGDTLTYTTDRGSWTPITVEQTPGSAPAYLSLVIDAQNQPLIAYQSLCGYTGVEALKLAAFDLPCPDRWDLDCDGIVNLIDFAELIKYWGPVAPDFEYDDDTDGFIDEHELVGLFEDWLWHRQYISLMP